MSDPIDPRLQYASSSSLPPSTLSHAHAHAHAHHSYPQAPALQNTAPGHQPYYLPTTPVHPQQPPLGQPAPPSNLDPALDQPAPPGHHASPDDDDDEIDAEDGCVPPPALRRILTLTWSSSLEHETPGSAKSPTSFKRPRACDSCRGLKVRCDQEPDQACRRCAKANRSW